MNDEIVADVLDDDRGADETSRVERAAGFVANLAALLGILALGFLAGSMVAGAALGVAGIEVESYAGGVIHGISMMAVSAMLVDHFGDHIDAIEEWGRGLV